MPVHMYVCKYMRMYVLKREKERERQMGLTVQKASVYAGEHVHTEATNTIMMIFHLAQIILKVAFYRRSFTYLFEDDEATTSALLRLYSFCVGTFLQLSVCAWLRMSL